MSSEIKKKFKKSLKNATKHTQSEKTKKKKLIENPHALLIQALVSVAHSHCLGRDSGGVDGLLLEECGDALLDDGSKQLPFYFAI